MPTGRDLFSVTYVIGGNLTNTVPQLDVIHKYFLSFILTSQTLIPSYSHTIVGKSEKSSCMAFHRPMATAATVV